jgi:hypothetical protein
MDNAPNTQSGGLWYCARCTKLIHPPGSAGVVEKGEHYCPACAEAAGFAKPQIVEAATPAMRKSRAVIIPVRPTPASGASARASARGPVQPHTPPIPVEKKPFPVAVAVAAGGVVLLIAGLVLILTGKPDSSVAQNGGKKPATTDSTPSTTTKPTTVAPTKPVENNADPAPMVRAPSDVNKTPEKTEITPAVTPTPLPTPAPTAVTPPPAKDEQETFKVELATATTLANSEKYSAALDILTRLKTAHEKAPWWDAQQKAWQDLEKLVQHRAGELSAEADDARGQAAKSDKPDVLDKLEAVWKPRVAGTSSGDGWTLLDPLTLEAANGHILTKQADGSVLASGPDSDQETYTVTTQTSLIGITAIRLDALTDPSLEGNGPGFHNNFVMSEFSVQASPANGGTGKPVTLTRPTADFCQRDAPVFTIECTLDGNPNSGWAVAGQTGRPHTAVYQTAVPLSEAGGVRLTFKLEFKSQWGKHVLGKFKLSATTSKTPQDANAALTAPVQAQPTADALVSAPARGVLKAIAESRARIADAAKQKRVADITARLDVIERQIKARPRNADPIIKLLDEVENLIAQDADVVEKFGERVGGMRFDAGVIRDGELAIYKAAVKQGGAGAEVLYDFANPDQFNAWNWDNPANGGTAEHDLKKGAVILKSGARHNWDGKDRRGMPVFKLPFYFRPDGWLVETDVAMLSDQNKPNKPDIGILVWDGSTNVARLSVQDSARGMHAFFSSSTPKRENFTSRPVPIAGKIKDNVRVQMSCSGGTLNCIVTSSTGASVTLPKEALGFEPLYVGLFIRNADDGENSSAIFQSVRIQGLPNVEKLKEIRDTRRVIASSNVKQDLVKRNGALRLLSENQIVPLSLEKVATWSSAKRMFQGATDEEKFIFPTWGMQMIQNVPFVIPDPKGDSANNIIVLNGPQGKVSNAFPQSVILPVNASAGAIHLLSGVSGWGFPQGEARSLSMIVRVQYDDNQMEEHKLLNGVHFTDYLKGSDVPESKPAISLGQQQVRYIALRVARPTATIKHIEFVKGDDKTAPVVLAVTLDKRSNVSSIPYSNTNARVVAEGKVGKAMAFFGKEFVEVPHAAELEPEKMTVEAWIYLEQFPTGEQRRWLVNKNVNEDSNGHYGLMINGPNAGAYMNINGKVEAWGTGGVQLKQWQHIAFTYDSVTLKVYLNGNQVAATPVNKTRVPGNTPLNIGRRQDGYVPFNGLMDEVRIYNRALPDDEIKAHFAKPAEASKDGQVGYWSFD